MNITSVHRQTIKVWVKATEIIPAAAALHAQWREVNQWQHCTLSVRPHMWETSKREPFSRQCFVASMMESLYWIGMAQPAKGTILPE